MSDQFYDDLLKFVKAEADATKGMDIGKTQFPCPLCGGVVEARKTISTNYEGKKYINQTSRCLSCGAGHT